MLLKDNDSFICKDNIKYLSENESFIPPYSIPVFESNDLNTTFINWNDIVSYSNTYSLDPIDTYSKICESNNISNALICVNEEDIIIDNTPLSYFKESEIVLRPVSKNTELYKFISEACEDYVDTEDESKLDILDEATAQLKVSDDQIEDIRMGRATGDNIENAVDKKFFNIIQQHINSLDRNVDYNKKTTKTMLQSNGKDQTSINSYSRDRKFLGRAVASLRSMYKNWLQKYNMEKDPSKKSRIKSLLAKIMNFIDRIMVKLQNKLS